MRHAHSGKSECENIVKLVIVPERLLTWTHFLLIEISHSCYPFYLTLHTPHSNKVRAFLDYSGIKYRVVEVNPMTKAEKKSNPQLAATKEVPVLMINGKLLLDSTQIIKNLNAIMNLYRDAKSQHVVTPDEESSLAFVDQRVVILTAPNIYRSFRESIDSFDYIAQNSQLSKNTGTVTLLATKYVGAVMMYLISEKKLKKKYNITDPRQMMYQALAEWSEHIHRQARRLSQTAQCNGQKGCSQVYEPFNFARLMFVLVCGYSLLICFSSRISGNRGQRFRGGAQPNLADITCFGVIRSLQNYATGRDIMNPANTSKEFVDWYRNVEQIVTKNKA